MKYFYYHQGELFCEKIGIKRLAKEVGTPFYLYSAGAVRENYQKINAAFASLKTLICYSLKANANLALCSLLAREGAGTDIVSGGELYQARKAGFPPEKIVFAGVGKKEEEIELALRENILMFNVESEGEIELIGAIAQKLSKVARVALRINPDIDPETHKYVTTGKKENKFGLALPVARKIYQKLKKNRWVKPWGIHLHIGSQIATSDPYLRALRPIETLLKWLEKQEIKVKYLNIGGGFGINYQPGQSSFDLEDLADKITPLISSRKLKLILEPGRYLVAKSGALITRLLYKKKQPSKTFLIVDAGMNDLIRPSLYQAYHEILKLDEPPADSPPEKVDVVGPICESGDFFAQERHLPSTKEGEYLSIMDTGAYGYSMSSSYNGRPKLPEILVEESQWWIVRERETYSDLTKGERIPLELSFTHSRSAGKPLYFTKMEGIGNDFIVIDNRSGFILEPNKLARQLCCRKKGIGADGLLLLEKSKKAKFLMRTFNSDGSEAEMCGNGARCAARYAWMEGLTNKKFTFETPSGNILAEVNNHEVRIKMKDPDPVELNLKITLKRCTRKGHFINTGVPHLIVFESPVNDFSLKEIAPQIRYHPQFQPQGTNVDFVRIEKDSLRVKTYERGVEAETLGCGTGAVASALISAAIYGISSPVKVKMKGGELTVWFEKIKKGLYQKVYLGGDANVVYRGKIIEGGINV